MQTLGYWSRPLSFIERAGARYGRRFTIRLLGQPPFVMLSDPDEIKEVFQAPPEVLHPGEGARMLEPLVGRYSVLLLDEEGHLEQRKLLLPAFHGERVQRMAGSMRELAEAEVASLPCGEEVELHLRLQRLTLEIILRTVFGLERPKPGDTRLRRESPFRPARLDGLRELLIDVLAFAESPLSVLPKPPRVLTIRGPIARQNRRLARVDELIFELIAERRREAREGDDVLALLLGAEHEDGSPMSPQELRDELVTALLVGHETTASQLAWGFERLARERAVLGRLYDELDDPAEAYLTATVQEILRHRPVLPNASPRLTMRPVEIGGVRYPKGVALVANIHLVHHDPEIYPEPQAFRPERFLEQAPGTYTWIPFGGGRRRCVGASFAVQQMKLVLRVMLERWELHPPATRVGGTRRRFSVVSPA
ncbi:MAG TPA: cytochrome P450, partial [Solirubrobacteraceae bacterium]|nr:cytochrome P450 [Solirubrobacteraceae bacterium]